MTLSVRGTLPVGRSEDLTAIGTRAARVARETGDTSGAWGLAVRRLVDDVDPEETPCESRSVVEASSVRLRLASLRGGL